LDNTRFKNLVVLNSDGSETPLAQAGWTSGGDFTPDGSHVVYESDSNIYVIEADGGSPELLLPHDELGIYWPTVSPDGSQIAYFAGSGDWGHSLRVMNIDGTGTRVVLKNDMTMEAGHVLGLDWSLDGRHLLFAIDSQGVYVVGTDGSGLTQVSSEGFENVAPHWSPDGSLISYNTGQSPRHYGPLVIVRRDGTHAQEFDSGRSGPWNPR
jgi:Tol biopolymer transport system component